MSYINPVNASRVQPDPDISIMTMSELPGEEG